MTKEYDEGPRKPHDINKLSLKPVNYATIQLQL